MKKVLSEILLWALYVAFGVAVGYVAYIYLDRPVSMSIIIGVGGFLLLTVGNEFLDRKLSPKKEIPTPEQFVESSESKGDRAIVREYILAGGDAEAMRDYLRSRR